MCTICSIKNVELIEKIENLLESNAGTLSIDNKKKLKAEYPDYSDSIDKILDSDCKLHWNFHQAITREPLEDNGSLKKDINRDEASVLSELLNKQAATFNCLTRKINKALENDEDISTLSIHPQTMEFYNNVANSIRSTVREIRELNTSVNGSKDGSLEGLKALARALRPSSNEKEEDLTSKDFD